MGRRAIFVLICFNLESHPSIQIILVNLLNLFSCIYYGYNKPFEGSIKTYLDAFNEFCITLVSWHMMMFTDFILDLDLRYQLGWGMITIICLNTFVNMIVILFVGGKQLYLICVKFYRILQRKYNKMNCLKKSESVETVEESNGQDQSTLNPLALIINGMSN